MQLQQQLPVVWRLRPQSNKDTNVIDSIVENLFPLRTQAIMTHLIRD
jgi:hypothetical protein